MGTARPTAREMYLSDHWLSRRSDSEQEECEKRFFTRVRLQNKVFKTTYARRLDDVNRAFNSLLPRDIPIQLMDVAISSGISTQEWIDSLSGEDFDFHMVAGDLNINAYLLSFSRSLEILVDRSGYPIHFDILGQGTDISLINFIPRSLSFLVKRSISRFLMRDARLAAYLKGQVEEGIEFGFDCTPIKLVSPRLRENPHLEIIEDDIVSNRSQFLDKRFHAIRAANILNRRYFDKDQINSILLNLGRRLRREGLLCVCRTLKNNKTNGTIFSLNENGRFQVEKRIGDGSEIEEDVLSLIQTEFTTAASNQQPAGALPK